MGKLVSYVYGDALFSLALEENALPEVWEEVKLVERVCSENNELIGIMTHPGMSGTEKQQLLHSVFGERLSDIMMGFLFILIEKRHFDEMESVLDYFQKKAKEYNKIGIAYVTTARSASEEQKKKIEAKLLEVTQYESLEMHFDEKRELIGGMVVRIGNRIIDDSIRAKLDEMKEGAKKA